MWSLYLLSQWNYFWPLTGHPESRESLVMKCLYRKKLIRDSINHLYKSVFEASIVMFLLCGNNGEKVSHIDDKQ